MPMKILRDASTVLAAQTGRLEPQAPAKRERTPSGYNCPKANHRVKEQMMSKLSLKMKLAVGFGTLLIILVVIATVAYTAVGSLAEAAKEVGRKASEKEMLVKIELAVAKGRSGSASYLLLDRNEALEVDEEGKRDYKDSIEELTPLVHSDEGKRLLSEVRHSYDNLRAVSDKEVQLRRSGKTKYAIQTLTRESDPAFKQLHENVKAFTSYLDKGLEEADKRQDATVSRCRVLILTLAALGFLLGAAVSGMTMVETARIRATELHRFEGSELLHLRGETVPLLRLRQIFKVQYRADEKGSDKVVILGIGERRFALLVDNLIGQESTVIKPLGTYLHHCSGIAGATISGDGRVRLVLDPADLLASASNSVAQGLTQCA